MQSFAGQELSPMPDQLLGLSGSLRTREIWDYKLEGNLPALVTLFTKKRVVLGDTVHSRHISFVHL